MKNLYLLYYMKQKKKAGRPKSKEPKQTRTIRITPKKEARIVKQYGSLSKAVETL